MFYFLEGKKIRRRRTTRSDCHIHYSFILPITSGDVFQDFANRMEMRTQGISSIETASFFSDEGQAWALKYSECDMSVQGRMWITEVGLREHKEKNVVIFSIHLSFSINAATELDISVLPPDPSIPRIVTSILSDIPGADYFFSTDAFPVQREVENIVTRADCQLLVDKIKSNTRQVAFIVFFGSTVSAKSESRILMRKLLAKVNIYLVDYNKDTIQLFETLKISQKNVTPVADFTKCRIFLPFQRFGSDISLHRSYNYNLPDFAEQKKRILSSQLSRHQLVEDGAVATIADIKTLIRINQFKKLRDKTDKKSDESIVYEQMISELENQNQQLKENVDNLELQKLALEDKLSMQEDEHKEKIHSLCQQHDGQFRKKTESGAIEFPQKMPDSMDTILLHARNLCPNLIITERAIKAAEDHNPVSCDKAWEIIHDMNHHLYRLKFVDKVQNIDREFKNVSRFEYAKTEGPATKADTSLAHQYQITHDGRPFEIWSHIIYEKDPKKLIRVYFAFDEENEKIIIGHFGPHLKNATSRKV